MIYLRYMYGRAGLADPPTVALHTPGIDWVDAQVGAEFAQLFPAGAVAVNPSGPGSFALHVLVSPSDAGGLAPLLAWGRKYRSAASMALGFYCLDPRRFDVVARDHFERWEIGRLLEDGGARARVRFPRSWGRFASVYGRCASFS